MKKESSGATPIWILASSLFLLCAPTTASPAGSERSFFAAAKLTAADGAAGDAFGLVAIRGDTAAVGAPGDDDLGTGSGAAYVFERGHTALGRWREVAKLRAGDGGAVDEFGSSVAVSGDTIVVGAIFDNDAAGSAYVFERDNGGPGTWEEVAKLTASDADSGEGFGTAADIDGDTVVVGAVLDRDDVDPVSGAAYVYQRDAGGPGNWGEVTKLTAGDGADSLDNFGWSVSISGDTIVVAAYQDDDLGRNSGSAYVFRETLVAPSLAVSGACPGEVSVAAAGLSPRGQLELYGARDEGISVIPGGFCVGTELGLDGTAVLGRVRADGSGGRTTTVTLPEQLCGAFLQLVDATSCATSAVVQLP